MNLESSCANCKAPREAAFCPYCGQNNRNFTRALPPVIGDLLRETFEVDGRLFNSLRLLFLQPGSLSAEFSANRRARYMSPVRLYLFASIVFFFVFSMVTDVSLVSQLNNPDVENLPVHVRIESDTEVSTEPRQVNAEHIGAFKRVVDPAAHHLIDEMVNRKDGYVRQIILSWAQSVHQEGPRKVSDLERIFNTQLVAALNSPQRTLESLIDNLPIAMFFLLPAYALLLKLIYIRSGKFYVEHLVFALHLHTMLFIVFTVIVSVPETSPIAWLDGVLGWGFMVYYFVALKRYYQQGYLKTFIKFWILVFTHALLNFPAMALVAAFTVGTL